MCLSSSRRKFGGWAATTHLQASKDAAQGGVLRQAQQAEGGNGAQVRRRRRRPCAGGQEPDEDADAASRPEGRPCCRGQLSIPRLQSRLGLRVLMPHNGCQECIGGLMLVAGPALP